MLIHISYPVSRCSKFNIYLYGLKLFILQFMEVVNAVGEGGEERMSELYRMFNEQGYSDYVVVYLRLIASAHLQEKAEFYQNFIEGNRTVIDFCHQVTINFYICTVHFMIIFVI